MADAFQAQGELPAPRQELGLRKRCLIGEERVVHDNRVSTTINGWIPTLTKNQANNEAIDSRAARSTRSSDPTPPTSTRYATATDWAATPRADARKTILFL